MEQPIEVTILSNVRTSGVIRRSKTVMGIVIVTPDKPTRTWTSGMRGRSKGVNFRGINLFNAARLTAAA